MPGSLMFKIVCYLGGTCGDLVVSMLDSRNSSIKSGAVTSDPQRQRLKKSWQFENDEQRDIYLSQIQVQYKSIPSHDADYHTRNHQSFIAIAVANRSTAIWASNRFKALHCSQVWEQMVATNGANSIEKYAQDMLDWGTWIQSYTNRIIKLEDILEGRADTKISSIIETQDIDVNFYNQWLQIQNENIHNYNTR